MQPSTLVPGAPQVLVAIGAGDPSLTELAGRIVEGLRRQSVPVDGPFAWPPAGPDATQTANCILVLGALGTLLGNSILGDSPKLLALFPAATDIDQSALLKPGGSIVATVIAKAEMSEKEATLFFVELFAELHAHCRSGIHAGMLRFCLAKAARLAPKKTDLWV